MNDGREAGVLEDFCAAMRIAGWTVTTQVDWADVVAERDGERIIGEAKGRTTSPGLDIDTLYGQLLRRMTDDAATRYAVIVPPHLLAAVERVPSGVREALRIDVFLVDEDGEVTRR